MNERSGYRSLNPAVPFLKPRQRLDACGIGKDKGDSATLGGVGGLALSAGLGLHGSSVAQGALGEAGFEELCKLHNFAAVVVRQLVVASGLELDGIAGMGEGEPGGSFGVLRVLFGEGHAALQSGPIPAMSNANSVTSDNASTFGKRIMNKLNKPRRAAA